MPSTQAPTALEIWETQKAFWDKGIIVIPANSDRPETYINTWDVVVIDTFVEFFVPKPTVN